MVNALSSYLDQPLALVSPTAYSVTLQRMLYLSFVTVLLFAASHFYSHHFVDGLWDVGSIALGFYLIRPTQEGVSNGYSLRWLTRYSLWNLFNVFLYVAAFVFQQVMGYPPVLPGNPPGGWESLDKTQQRVAIVAYDLEQLAYIAAAVILWLLYKELKSVSPRAGRLSGERGETYHSLMTN